MGSTNIRLATAGNDIVISEPSVVALSRDDSRKIISCGNAAVNLNSRIPGGVKLVYPFNGETVPDFNCMKAIFSYIIGKGKAKNADTYISYSGKHSKEIEKVIVESAQEAGAGNVLSVDPSYAAACGCGFRGMGENLIVNIGASVCDIAAYSHSKLAAMRSCGFAGKAIDKAIGTGIFHRHRFSITPETAENIKLSFVSLTRPKDLTFEIPVTKPTVGLPSKIRLTPAEVSEYAEKITDELIDEVLDVIRSLPAEPDRVVLTGGGAQLDGLSAALESIIHFPVVVAKNPSEAVIRGIVQIADSDEN